MALEKLADRITQDTCSVLLLFAFTLIRILVLRSNAKTAHSILPSELFSVLCLVFTTFCVVAQVAVSEVDNRIRFGLTDPAAIAAHEYEPLTLQMNFIQSFMSALAVWALKGAYISTFFAMSSALSRASVRSLYGVTIFAGFSFVASLLLHSLWCRPISANWHPTLTPTGFEGCLYVSSLEANGIFMGLNVVADILIAIVSVIVIRSVQINKRIEWLAICFILLVGLTSVAAAVTRYAVLVWIWTGPSDGRRLTAGNFGLIEICVRLEIIFGAAAYGLCFARSLMRRTIKYFMELSESLRSIVSSRSSRGKSDHQEEEDERVLKPASLASGPGYDLEEMRGPG